MQWSALPRRRSSNGIAFHRCGDGPPVVLLHGVGLRSESWNAQIDALSARYTVHALDMLGHGESPRAGTERPALADYTDHVAAVIETEIGGPARIAGHSMGALIALDLAARYPEHCCAVAALNAIFRRTPEASRAVRERAASLGADTGEEAMTTPVRRWFGAEPSGAALAAAEACRGWLTGADRAGFAAAYRVFAASDGAADEALAGLGVPALLATGVHDTNSTPGMSRSMANLVPGARYAAIEDAGHMMQMTHVEEVNAMLTEVFDAAPADASCARRPGA